MVSALADQITAKLAIPTIGIGASPGCDGQILVTDDMVGLIASPPSFVRRYATMADDISAAVRAYAEDVRARKFHRPNILMARGRSRRPDARAAQQRH